MSALTIHKPLLATQLGKVFAFCPCARKEPPESRFTGRHLSQFYQIEVEMPKATYKKAMKLLEKLIEFVIRDVKEKCEKELKILKRDLKIPKLPFKKFTHREIVDIMRKRGVEVSYDEEIPWKIEKEISLEFSEPFFIIDYPKGSRGFYDKDADTHLLDFDLILPEGFGECVSGSEREWEYKKIFRKISKTNDPKKFAYYLDMAKSGIIPTSGFGIGLERLTRYICGADKIWEVVLFPKVPGIVSV